MCRPRRECGRTDGRTAARAADAGDGQRTRRRPNLQRLLVARPLLWRVLRRPRPCRRRPASAPTPTADAGAGRPSHRNRAKRPARHRPVRPPRAPERSAAVGCAPRRLAGRALARAVPPATTAGRARRRRTAGGSAAAQRARRSRQSAGYAGQPAMRRPIRAVGCSRGLCRLMQISRRKVWSAETFS